MIIVSCQDLLIVNGETWVKTMTGTNDITMVLYPEAEICEHIGLYLLSRLRKNNIECVLYRDDGAVLTAKPRQQVEIMKKKICETFRKHGLSITIEANQDVIDILDLTLDLFNNCTINLTMPPNL